jgi:uncharacterized protein YndB with AHSA1/START domain
MGDETEQTLSPRETEYGFVVEREMRSSPERVFAAWTERFDTWFALPGAISMDASVGRPYWFDVEHEGTHYSHYGRFLQVKADRLLEFTWVTGRNGTDGAETVVRVELSPRDAGTLLRLSHGGFYDEVAVTRHRDVWPMILEHLDAKLQGEAG